MRRGYEDNDYRSENGQNFGRNEQTNPAGKFLSTIPMTQSIIVKAPVQPKSESESRVSLVIQPPIKRPPRKQAVNPITLKNLGKIVAVAAIAGLLTMAAGFVSGLFLFHLWTSFKTFAALLPFANTGATAVTVTSIAVAGVAGGLMANSLFNPGKNNNKSDVEESNGATLPRVKR